MNFEKPSNSPKSEGEQIDIKTMEQELRDSGIAFPARWDELSDEQKLRIMNSFKSGGLTALGFRTSDSILDTSLSGEQEGLEHEEEPEEFQSE